MIYTSTMTSASLRLRESRVVADLLLRGVSGGAWRESIVEDNVLRMHSVESNKRIWDGGFIETKADIEAFLDKLCVALEAATEADERVQIK
ncbi:MAG: DUF1819 family protein [Deltaproteobacteria bacterium]|nr:DUF1819 family protein [Deltaproteobacteria bacterium]